MSPKPILANLCGLGAALAALSAAPQGAVAKSPLEGAEAKASRQCFLARRADGFAAPDEKNLYVRAGVREVYHFEMFGHCNELDWAQKIALVSRASDWICQGVDAEVITPTAIGPQKCLVRNMRRLTDAEAKALPKRARP